MVICHCRRVNDRTITELVSTTCSTVEEVSGRCGAGSDCGGCRTAIQALLDAVEGRPAAAAPAERVRRRAWPAPSWNDRLAG